MIYSLPDLCLDLILEQLSTTHRLRRTCDVVRDCINLAASSREIRSLLSVPLSTMLNPPNIYEMLQARPSVLALELKTACRVSGLAVSGNKNTLQERLKNSLHDERSQHCGMGRKFCDCAKRVHNEDYDRSQARRLLDEFGMGYAVLRRCKSLMIRELHSLILAPFDGNVSWLVTSKTLLELERDAVYAERRAELKEALMSRGCTLRPDSRVCEEYMGNVGYLSIQAIVAYVEEMKFYYEQTDYQTILFHIRKCDKKMRLEYPEYKYDEHEYERVKEFHRSDSKREALREWIGLHWRLDKSHLTSVPESVATAIDHEIVQAQMEANREPEVYCKCVVCDLPWCLARTTHTTCAWVSKW